MKNLITGIHHISLNCLNDQEFQTTLAFYHDVLQMDVIRRWGSGTGQGVMLQAGTGIIEIILKGDRRSTMGAIRHFALAVENVDECVELVRKSGYKITVEPKDTVIASETPYPARIAFCIGPVGEEIEFFQER